jgi:protein-disulfide isomerase
VRYQNGAAVGVAFFQRAEDRPIDRQIFRLITNSTSPYQRYLMKRYLPFLIVGTVALLTVGSGAVLYRAKRPVALVIPKGHESSGLDESTHVRGNPQAPLTLEEFGDFQCPPCGKLAPVINKLERDHGQELRVIFHHLPLSIHAHAREAAWAAEAAGLQSRYWEMHDLLYREQAVWSSAPDVRALFTSYAGILGLNIDRFRKDMETDKVKARVTADEKRARDLGVTDTPTVFINSQAVPPMSLNEDGLRGAINEAKASSPERSK